MLSALFLFNTSTSPETYTLSLHDALPIYVADFEPDLDADLVLEENLRLDLELEADVEVGHRLGDEAAGRRRGDRKSTRLNSSHTVISYAVFCLKKKKKLQSRPIPRQLHIA